MPRVFARPCTSLSAFQMKPYSTMECGAERQTHDMLRHTVERLWHPFTQGYRGADLNIYRFRENLAGLCCPGNIFTCQVNGLLGGTRVLEDFFATLLSGFDIVHASVEGSRGKPLSNPADICNYTGYYVLAHTRPFLGWQPSPTSLRSTGPTSALPGTTIRSSVQYEFNGATPETASRSAFLLNDCDGVEATDATATLDGDPDPSSKISTLIVPFTTYVEGLVDHSRLSHVVLRTPVMELLRTRPECPEAVQKCLESREALKIFATLRRAGVKPELITATTLLSASKRDPAWMSALGIL
ncbi:conserved hypothetical protein [Leishmania infantum JPCM5]|uniref:Uncharacterized protein n=2 Tax=Leishmania infantum TaxID=5671 RepID=A4IBW4_LEIIN|nr:conserved hypothetical protein [Leishmania infantum JPCM5]CAC9546707.1 hypothetical_protein_-_conserved [Leishmania infantum]CAM72336.1 conserved hypothetical protein [Leishmania infantum JPCM5]SUZ46255.1 hypothetical_protein_-_conserved [Leishmania infantum]|eukprot:XP_001469233.1 conserved hypothetical protein [Leishmania infantum JPCM5]